MKVTRVALSRLLEDPAQPRRDITEAEIRELADSIKEHGVLQPIIVRNASDGYVVVAGHRRVLAAKRGGLESIDAIVRDDPAVREDARRFGLQVVENLQREQLSDLDLARAVGRMVDEFGMQRQAVAKMLSRSPATVTRLLDLLKAQWSEFMPAVGPSVSAIAQIRTMEEKTRRAVLKRHLDTGETFNSNELLKIREYAKKVPVTPALIPKILGARAADIKAAAASAVAEKAARSKSTSNPFAVANLDDDEATVARLFRRENFEGRPLALPPAKALGAAVARAVGTGTVNRVELPALTLSDARARDVLQALGGSRDVPGWQLTAALINALVKGL